jgi:hypothetical protein
MDRGEFRRMEKSHPTEVVGIQAPVIKLYSRLSISAKTCWSATNAPPVPKTLFGTDNPVHFDYKESVGWSPSLASGFLQRSRFPHNLTACYEVREQKGAAIPQCRYPQKQFVESPGGNLHL